MDLSDDLIQAFLNGDVEAAYKAALVLQKAYHEALLELSQLRFKTNFGTSTCQNCEGLKAGPGVVATCYQVQRCNFSNIREGSEDPKQLRLIQLLNSKT